MNNENVEESGQGFQIRNLTFIFVILGLILTAFIFIYILMKKTIILCVIIIIILAMIYDLIRIISKRHDFKYFCKINDKHKIKDISLIVIYSLIITVLVTMYVSVGIVLSWLNKQLTTPEFAPAHNKAMILIKRNLPNPRQYKTSQEFASALVNNMPLIQEVYYFSVEGKENLSFNKQEIKKCKLKKYVSNPTFITTDGIIYSIIKYEQGCKIVDLRNQENSSCVIEIDANGLRKPNKYAADRVLLVINGNSQ